MRQHVARLVPFLMHKVLISVALIVLSCKVSEKKENAELASIYNTSDVVTVAKVEVVDSRIYSVLDSVIYYTERCRYFNSKYTKLYAFSISSKTINDEKIIDINANISVENALGLQFREIEDVLNLPEIIMGGFYYKDYLFTVPLRVNGVDVIVDYPFIQKSDCELRVLVTPLPDKKTYSSYVRFTETNGDYFPWKNRICGGVILIR